jgi:hypothetical protein
MTYLNHVFSNMKETCQHVNHAIKVVDDEFTDTNKSKYNQKSVLRKSFGKQVEVWGVPYELAKAAAKAQAYSFLNLKPELQALWSHHYGPGRLSFLGLGLGWLMASSWAMHITSESNHDLEDIRSMMTSNCPWCLPTVTLDLSQGQGILEHIGSHILYDPTIIRSIEPPVIYSPPQILLDSEQTARIPPGVLPNPSGVLASPSGVQASPTKSYRNPTKSEQNPTKSKWNPTKSKQILIKVWVKSDYYSYKLD